MSFVFSPWVKFWCREKLRQIYPKLYEVDFSLSVFDAPMIGSIIKSTKLVYSTSDRYMSYNRLNVCITEFGLTILFIILNPFLYTKLTPEIAENHFYLWAHVTRSHFVLLLQFFYRYGVYSSFPCFSIFSP